ncbi:unnamed protein product [Closterium sp. Naga37s-1]|nr:unnamed protein product [Closterium sp. Naga37s-1]
MAGKSSTYQVVGGETCYDIYMFFGLSQDSFLQQNAVSATAAAAAPADATSAASAAAASAAAAAPLVSLLHRVFPSCVINPPPLRALCGQTTTLRAAALDTPSHLYPPTISLVPAPHLTGTRPPSHWYPPTISLLPAPRLINTPPPPFHWHSAVSPVARFTWALHSLRTALHHTFFFSTFFPLPPIRLPPTPISYLPLLLLSLSPIIWRSTLLPATISLPAPLPLSPSPSPSAPSLAHPIASPDPGLATSQTPPFPFPSTCHATLQACVERGKSMAGMEEHRMCTKYRRVDVGDTCESLIDSNGLSWLSLYRLNPGMLRDNLNGLIDQESIAVLSHLPALPLHASQPWQICVAGHPVGAVVCGKPVQGMKNRRYTICAAGHPVGAVVCGKPVQGVKNRLYTVNAGDSCASLVVVQFQRQPPLVPLLNRGKEEEEGGRR